MFILLFGEFQIAIGVEYKKELVHSSVWASIGKRERALASSVVVFILLCLFC